MPNVIVIDNKKNKGKVCCYTEAARIIGISKADTIRAWALKAINENRNREHYRHFEVLFVDVEIIKQKKGSYYRKSGVS
jgi:alkylated DNA nucleotide flippase Atl1